MITLASFTQRSSQVFPSPPLRLELKPEQVADLEKAKPPGAVAAATQQRDETGGERGPPTSPVLFGELKHSISATRALKAARKQLRRRMTLGASRLPGLAGMAICFEMSWEAGTLSGVSRSLLRLEEICEALTAHPNQNEMISLAGDGSELLERLVSDGILDS